MSQSFRHPLILDIARREGKVTVEGLADHFDVTTQTIRRDLNDLAEAGKLKRVHGGAVLASGVTNIRYEYRRDLNAEEKAAIGRRCAKAVPEGASLFMSIGTSTEAVARELLATRNLMIVTNNINVANIMAGNQDCEVLLTGGLLRRTDGGLVGNLATVTIEQFKFDYAVIGCSALDEDGDLLDFDIQEVDVSQTIIRQARKVYLVADASKFDRTAPVRIASLRDIDVFFTDRPVPKALERACAEWETALEICAPPSPK